MEAVAAGTDPLAPGESSPLPTAPPAAPTGATTPAIGGRLREGDVSRDEEGLRTLAAAGAWRAVASLGQGLLQSSHPVDVLLRLRWYRIVALLKVRESAQAEREMSLLGDLYGPSWDYERYPALFPGRRGSMVPFALQLLHGVLPAMTGETVEAQRRLFALLQRLQRQIPRCAAEEQQALAAGGDTQRASDALADARRQQQQVVLALANVCCSTGDYPLALVHMEQLIDASAADMVPAPSPPPGAPLRPGWQLLAMLGRLHLQVGNLEAAGDAFDRLECLALNADQCVAVRLHRGLMGVAAGQCEAAVIEFEAALQLDPTHAMAANNLAVCHLYCGKLQEAISCLEAYVRADPRARMQHAVAANLAALYQMTDSAATSKQELEQLALDFAPDDFDLSALTPLA